MSESVYKVRQIGLHVVHHKGTVKLKVDTPYCDKLC